MILHLSLFRAVFTSSVLFLVFSASPGLREYLVSVELNFSDVSALNQLKALLNRTVFPIRINDAIQVSDINITTGNMRASSPVTSRHCLLFCFRAEVENSICSTHREQTNRTNEFTPKVDFCLFSNECLCTVCGSWTTCCRRNQCMLTC